MKYSKILILFFLLCSEVNAQSILVEYESKRSDDNTIAHINVWITDTITTYKHQVSSSTEISFVKKKKEGFVYNTEKFQSRKFYVKDSLHNFKWELLPDTATILKRKCLGAKTVFRGRTYIVFYTPSIPISDGPWKFGGLPGLILEAKSIDGFITWHATKLDLTYKGSFEYVDVSKNTYSAWATYVEKYKEMIDRMIRNMRSSDAVKNVKMKIKMPSIELFHLVQSEGIEIEN